jgi:hypothetical protein
MRRKCHIARVRDIEIAGEETMKASELVAGQEYDVKLFRKDAKRGDDGLRLCAFVGTNGDRSVDGNGVTNECYLFKVVNPRHRHETEIKVLFIEDVARKVRISDSPHKTTVNGACAHVLADDSYCRAAATTVKGGLYFCDPHIEVGVGLEFYDDDFDSEEDAGADFTVTYRGKKDDAPVSFTQTEKWHSTMTAGDVQEMIETDLDNGCIDIEELGFTEINSVAIVRI